MRVIIPVAGLGSRLKPHTFTTPKPLMDVAGKPILEYIIKEIQSDDLKFKNLIYNDVFEIYNDYLSNNKPITDRVFVNNSDENIRKLAADLLSRSYHLSPRWKKSGNIIETEEMRLVKDVPKSLIVYKSKVLVMAEKKYKNKLTEVILEGKDVLGGSATGSGKTLALVLVLFKTP